MRDLPATIFASVAGLAGQVPDALLPLEILVLVALPFQALWPAVRRRPKVFGYEYWLDVIYGCQNIWLSFLSFYVLAQWLVSALYGDSQHWFPSLRELPFWLQAALAVWAFDFAVYWRHRLEHAFAALWAFHAVHHTAEKIDVLTTLRLHPFELMLGVLFNVVVIRAGLDPAATALGSTIYLNYNYFIHANVRIRFRGVLQYILVSPFMHQWHHATDAAAAGKNVGVVFAWNDWLFGTAYHPQHWPTHFGLSGPPAEQVGQSYWRQLLYPLQFLVVRIAAWRKPAATGPTSGTPMT
jgi:sterol desaturase/sphingolipid hydroxylase (fatty acid hydroxylase superfamily)